MQQGTPEDIVANNRPRPLRPSFPPSTIVHPVKQDVEHEPVTEQTNRDQSNHKHSHRAQS
jgi:hypothetical protein